MIEPAAPTATMVLETPCPKCHRLMRLPLPPGLDAEDGKRLAGLVLCDLCMEGHGAQQAQPQTRQGRMPYARTCEPMTTPRSSQPAHAIGPAWWHPAPHPPLPVKGGFQIAFCKVRGPEPIILRMSVLFEAMDTKILKANSYNPQ